MTVSHEKANFGAFCDMWYNIDS